MTDPLTQPGMVERFWSKVAVRGPDDCWEWQAHTSSNRNGIGYGKIAIAGKMKAAHRVSYELANGPIPDGKLIRHRCDNPPCVNPAHLEIGTHKDNVADRYERGRAFHLKGSRHQNSKFTEDQVRHIRAECAAGASRRGLARQYGVTPFSIYYIVSKGWSHVR